VIKLSKTSRLEKLKLKEQELLEKLDELKKNHTAIQFIDIRNKSVSFSVKGHFLKFIYLFDYEDKWGIAFGNEVPESKAFMKDLIKAGIVTRAGKANLVY
jgi:hypothetical protein